MATSTTLADSAGTDGFGFIDDVTSVGLTIFDNVYGTVTGKPPVTTVTPKNNTAPGGTFGLSTNALMMFVLIGVGLWAITRK